MFAHYYYYHCYQIPPPSIDTITILAYTFTLISRTAMLVLCHLLYSPLFHAHLQATFRQCSCQAWNEQSRTEYRPKKSGGNRLFSSFSAAPETV